MYSAGGFATHLLFVRLYASLDLSGLPCEGLLDLPRRVKAPESRLPIIYKWNDYIMHAYEVKYLDRLRLLGRFNLLLRSLLVLLLLWYLSRAIAVAVGTVRVE